MTDRPRIPAVILASGLSRRMGEDKALINLGDTALALHIARRLAPQASTVFLNAPSDHPLADSLPILSDRHADRPGPLAGILAALKHFVAESGGATHVLTTPCDTPFLPHDLLERLARNATVGTIVMAASGGRTHPVTALWPMTLADDLEEWLTGPANRRVFDFVARHPSITVEFPVLDGFPAPIDPFFNINTPEDLAFARHLFERGVT